MGRTDKDTDVINNGHRFGNDRRLSHTNPFSLKSFTGRRRTIRRLEDRRKSPYVDKYSTRLFLFCMFILFLCVGDAFMTLVHLSRGGRELNPLMEGLLQKGTMTFFWVKYLLSSLCVVLLVIYVHYPFVRLMMIIVAAVYSILLLYHLYPFMILAEPYKWCEFY